MDYEIQPFSREREIIVDAGRLASRRHIAHCLIEADVTRVRELLRAAATSGNSLSFTAFVVASLATAIGEVPTVQAYRDWRRRLLVFHDVDVVTMIEPEAGAVAIPHIVRTANRKTVREITEELRSIQLNPDSSEQHGGLVALAPRLPRSARGLFYWALRENPRWFKRLAGTVVVTSVGMFGKGGGWGLGFLPMHTLGLAVGGIAEKPGVYEGEVAIREYVNLTLSFDHDIVDGAPAAMFAKTLRELIETATCWERETQRGDGGLIVAQIDYDSIAEIYDLYATADYDIPFLVSEVRKVSGPALELMAGTGRVSIPLLEAGAKLTCVDGSPGMLDVLAAKLTRMGLHAEICCIRRAAAGAVRKLRARDPPVPGFHGACFRRRSRRHYTRCSRAFCPVVASSVRFTTRRSAAPTWTACRVRSGRFQPRAARWSSRGLSRAVIRSSLDTSSSNSMGRTGVWSGSDCSRWSSL